MKRRQVVKKIIISFLIVLALVFAIGCSSNKSEQPSADAETIPVEEIDFAVVPCVTCNKIGQRLGHGGGFYDRYLQAHEKHPTAAVAFDFQVFDEVPFVNTDIRPQILVTPQCILQRPR